MLTVEQFLADLESVSRTVARQNGNTDVSSGNVRDAAIALTKRGRGHRWLVQFCIAVGGALLGAGVAELITVAATESAVWTTAAVLWGVIPSLGGAFAVSYGLSQGA
ncbi:MAG: hypothetical protein JWO67_3455 [Streptosporangiaceae bacterium]|nr:hypothetical protein [Streptosporangiaceae bacterium]